MKLFPTIIFSLSIIFLIVGIHQIMVNGFTQSYWILSFSTVFFLWFAYMKRNEKPGEEVYKKYSEMRDKKINKVIKKKK